MESIAITQIQVDDPEYRHVYDLREAILRKPIGLSLADEDLGADKNDITLAAKIGEKVVGCIMLQHKDASTIKFRQMAVSEELQGKGVGYEIMTAAEALSKEKGYSKIVLNARETAARFYSKLGYNIISPLFTEVGIPHYVMEKTFNELL